MSRAAQRTATPPPGEAELLASLGLPALLVARDGRVARANVAAEELLGISQGALKLRGLPRELVELVDRAGEGGMRAHGVVFLAGWRRIEADVTIDPIASDSDWLAMTLSPRAPQRTAPAVAPAPGLAAMMAHEIKNPLAGIRGAAQLLGQTADAEGRELTALIASEVDRITRLIERFEALARPGPVALVPVNLNEVMSHVQRVGQGLAPEARLREEYDPSLPPVLGERDALVQLFLNLVKNAVEATEGMGEIILRTAYRHGARVAGRALPIEACVLDDGPGLPDAISGRLFEPFVSTKPRGGGLGLAMVAKIAAEHGASVDHARLGGRTCLRVRFAAAAAAPEAAA